MLLQLGTPASFDAAEVDCSIPERFARQLFSHPDRPAVITANHQWTYAQLDRASDRLAAVMAPSSRGAESADPVALLMDHDAPLIATILAAVKVGRPYVVLGSADTALRRQATYARSGADLLVADSSNWAEGVQLTKAQGSLVDAAVCLAQSNAVAEAGATRIGASGEVSAGAIASLTFTSGTTGDPKGVCHSHRTVLHHCRNYTLSAQLCPDDRVSLLTPCNLAASMSSLWGALLNGAALFPFDLRAHGINALPAWIRQHRLTVLHCVPTVFRSLMSILAEGSDGEALDALRLIRLGGEAIYARDLELFKRHTDPACRLFVGFSSTETGAACTGMWDHDSHVTGPRLPIGRPTTGMEIELLDESGNPVAAGEVGRIVVKSQYLSQGYWHDPKLTAARFVIDSADGGARRFDTGDMGRFDAQGFLEHCGRADDCLKIRGHRVDPTEVEGALLALPEIHQAKVIGLADPAGQTQLIAYVVSPAELFPGEGSLRSQLRECFPEHMVPSDFVRLDELPRTAGGKIDRSALPDPRIARGSPSRPHSAPADDSLESQIAAIWEDVLGKGAAGRGDDFFLDLGGSSIDAASVIIRLERLLGRPVPMSALMQYRTVSAFAEHVRLAATKPSNSPLVLVQRGSPGRTPFFFVHGDVYGSGMYCPGLARQLGADQPFYALAPLGFDHWPPPLSIEGMAQRFVREVRAVQPTGPYLLGGFCNGGLVAYEMARQLEASGQRIDLLALVRARPAKPRWPGLLHLIGGVGTVLGIDPRRQSDLFVRIHDHLQRWRRVSRLGLRARLRYAVRFPPWLVTTLAQHMKRASPPIPSSRSRAHAVFTVHRRAMLLYSPGSYRGRILLFWPEQEAAALRGDESAGWRRVAPGVISHWLPGGHESCITTHAEVLAQSLRKYLREARDEHA